MGEIYDYNVAAGSNNLAPPNGFPENMDYRDVNDAARELMAVQARYLKAVNGSVTSTGAQPAYAITVAQTLAAYAAGQIFTFVAHADATGACTLNVNALGAGAIVDSRGNQLTTADIRNGGIYKVIRTAAGNFRVVGHMSAASLQALVVNTFATAFTTTGTQPAYVITTGVGLLAYATGQLFAFIAHATSTGAVTLNVDSLGAGNVVDSQGNQLGSGDVLINGLHFVTRRGTVFQVVGEVIDLSTQASGVLPVANGGTGQSTIGAAANALAQAGAGFGTQASIASAATTDLGTAPSHNILVTGSVTISSFGSSALSTSPVYYVRFPSGGLTLTNGANLICPGSVDLKLNANDRITAELFAAGQWIVTDVHRNNSGLPTVQRFTSGTAATYTPTAGTAYIEVQMVGGGGGGAAQTTNNGTAGGASSFGTWTANGGAAGLIGATGTNAAGGTGGTDGTGTKRFRVDGQDGMTGVNFNPTWGGAGGSSFFGGGGAVRDRNPGSAAKANTGSGGGAGGVGTSPMSGSGASGEYVQFFMSAAQIGASLTYTVGTGGPGGAAGALAGAAGAAGVIIVTEYPY